MNELHGQLFKGISSIFGKEVSDHHCSWLSYPTTDKPLVTFTLHFLSNSWVWFANDNICKLFHRFSSRAQASLSSSITYHWLISGFFMINNQNMLFVALSNFWNCFIHLLDRVISEWSFTNEAYVDFFLWFYWQDALLNKTTRNLAEIQIKDLGVKEQLRWVQRGAQSMFFLKIKVFLVAKLCLWIMSSTEMHTK